MIYIGAWVFSGNISDWASEYRISEFSPVLLNAGIVISQNILKQNNNLIKTLYTVAQSGQVGHVLDT